VRKRGVLGLFSDGHFDYSRFGRDVLPDLTESDLDEPTGLNAGDDVKDYGTQYYCGLGSELGTPVNGLQQAVDWNCDGDKTGTSISRDINKDQIVSDGVTTQPKTLATVNEWLHLRYNGGASAVGVFGPAIELPAATSMVESPEITLEEDLSIGLLGILTVQVDIKPGSFPNNINPKSNGVVPVAILTTNTFAATTVDPLSVTFGPRGAVEAYARGHLEDVDGDGDTDMVLHFRTQETGIVCGDTSATLEGRMVNGLGIRGIDSVQTVGCN
jgi:hypothetical protein